MIRAFKPDVVVLDIAMPRMSGIETLAEARRITAAPVLLISGYDFRSDSVQGMGAVQFLPKPFNPDDLVSMLSELRPARIHRCALEPQHVSS